VTHELVVRGGTVWLPDGPASIDVAADDGLITAIGPELDGRTVVDAAGCDVLPGVIDAHVHLNDPGRAHWEGFATGTLAHATGGGTCLADMPLNSSPPTVDGASLQAKLAAAAGRAYVDYLLWGGLVPGPLDRLDELAAGGVCGFKAFMTATGVDDFERADELTLYEGMCRAAALGLPVAVHAENDEIAGRLGRRAVAEGRTTMRDYLRSRPVVAETDAIAAALACAASAGCHLHVVHVSTAAGVALVAEARSRGQAVSCETCPHYILLTDEDAERIGALAKCSPPLRPPAERNALLAAIADIDLIASDHAPSSPDLKRGDNAFAVWGGISGCQTTLRATLTAGVRLLELPRLLGTGPAALLGLSDHKGRIVVGHDADLVVVDAEARARLDPAELRYRHPQSPYAGMQLAGDVLRVLLRGQPIHADRPDGRFCMRFPLSSEEMAQVPPPSIL
jgi:allantoinase